MAKKIVSLLTLVAFIIFSLSCTVYTTKEERSTKAASWGGKRVKILGVLKTSGEKIEFPKEYPASLSGSYIRGIRFGKTLLLDRENIQSIRRDKKQKMFEITTNDGKTYVGILEKETTGGIFIKTFESISIPLHEVELAWVKKVNPGLTFLASFGSVVLVLGVGILILALTKESCPFIYSFNGEEYIFDAEPYGGSTCPAFQRTEWCGLQYLKEVNSRYRIKITNEVDETQYTDELRLVVVDHPQGVKVVPDESGKIYTISQPIIPVQAIDGKGRDLLPYFSENDWIYWQTRTEEKDPDVIEDLKDELIFEFPKPRDATMAKLLFNGCNTLWGSQMVKRFLELHGNEVDKYYEEVSNFGPAYTWLRYWNLRDELYRLHIRVETQNGWQSKGTIVGGGPFVSEDKIYIIDLKDVPGDTLRIKLTPPAAFWILNYLALDYTEDLPITITEIDAIEAIDHKGQDVREILAENDNTYLIMPNIRDYAELVFESPPRIPGMDRSVILKASGYYDIHLEAKGEPQRELLKKFVREPGAAISYALKEYRKWKNENMESYRQR